MSPDPTRAEDIERIKAGADLHTTVSAAIVKAFGCGLKRVEITDVVMSIICLLPLNGKEDDDDSEDDA
jgi:hypothetical protein